MGIWLAGAGEMGVLDGIGLAGGSVGTCSAVDTELDMLRAASEESAAATMGAGLADASLDLFGPVGLRLADALETGKKLAGVSTIGAGLVETSAATFGLAGGLAAGACSAIGAGLTEVLADNKGLKELSATVLGVALDFSGALAGATVPSIQILHEVWQLFPAESGRRGDA